MASNPQPRQEQPKEKAPKRPLTWQEKIDQGQRLNVLDETKADADFNHKKRVRDQEEREAYEARKRGETREDESQESEE